MLMVMLSWYSVESLVAEEKGAKKSLVAGEEGGVTRKFNRVVLSLKKWTLLFLGVWTFYFIFYYLFYLNVFQCTKLQWHAKDYIDCAGVLKVHHYPVLVARYKREFKYNKEIWDHLLFSAFLQEYREYTWGRRWNSHVCFLKMLILVIVPHREITQFNRVFDG